ncbi:zinc finger protein [Saccharopolyspora taberi]|uniref:Zinc-finger n=1 Tax=Saccharopolyspora taberi TaxID=60895 RepID=A0ABN3VLV6_9PSEU
MYPFHWVPCEGSRHASLDARPAGGYPTGTEVTTLCGKRLPADNSELAWLWPTCPPCNREAHRLAAPALELQRRILNGLIRF